MNKNNKNGRIRLFLIVFYFIAGSINAVRAEASSIYDQRTETIREVMRQQRVSLSFKNAPFKEVLLEIQRQSGVDFLITQQVEKELGNISVELKNVTVEQAITSILSKTGYTFEIKDSVVTFKKQVSKQSSEVSESIVVVGTVVDEKEVPVVGATVVVLGTNTGVTTNHKGEFSLKAKLGDKVQISFVGMRNAVVTVTKENGKNLRVRLAAQPVDVEEVVVTGIFNRRSGSFTGAAATLKRDDLKRVGNQNIFASLKSLDPSLMIFDNLDAGSDPNKNPKMSLRGTSEFDIRKDELDIKGTYGNDPNAPLFILDGFETTVERIMDLDMNRIESLTILKDASAKAIYGSKAANGVIVIETRKRGDSDLRITYNGSVDIQMPDLSSYNLTNSRQKLELEKLADVYTSKHLGDIGSQLILDEMYNRRLTAIIAGVNTDWLSKPLHTGVGNKHSISLDLGSKTLAVLADFSYNNIIGVMKGSKRDNYSGVINVSYRHKKFVFRNILSVTKNKSEDSPYGSFSEYAAVNPYLSPYDSHGQLLKNCLLSMDPYMTDNEFVDNPLYNSQLNTKIEQNYLDVTNNLYVEWLIADGFKATARLGITERRNGADEFYPSNHLKFRGYQSEDFSRKGSYTQNVGWNKRMTSDFNAQYNVTLKQRHDLFFNVGFNLNEDSFEEVVYRAEGFPSDRMNDIIFAKQFLKESKPSGQESTKRDIGVLGFANYSYDARYMVDLSFRMNGSSQFGKNNRWGKFWSVGLGWNLNNEKFLRDVEFIQMLKLRASVGYTGAQTGDAYDAMSTYTYNTDRNYKNQLGAYLKAMKNDELKWQQKMDYNIGIDVNLARKLIITFDLYRSYTQNNLINVSALPSIGFTSYIENLGNVENKGFDAKVTYNAWQNLKKNAYLSLTASFFANKNKIKDISSSMKHYNENQDKLVSNVFSANKPVKKYYDGASLNDIWAVRSLGIDPANGQEIYLDKNGVPTYAYSASDMVVVGNELPKLSGVGGLNFQYQGWGLNVSMRYSYGAKLYNSTLVSKVENADISANVDVRMYDGVWKKPGDKKPYKKAGEMRNPETGKYERLATQPTSRFVQRRNEFTLSNLSLSYDFRGWRMIERANMESLKLSLFVNDLFTISSIDIERGTSYPFARNLNIAITASF